MHSKRISLQAVALVAYECLATLVTALVVLVVLFTFFFRVVEVKGDSMNNTLHNGEHLLLQTVVSEYRCGDIVVIDRYVMDPMIKRVVAVGGDEVHITSDGKLYVNGRQVVEPYANGVTLPIDTKHTIRVPDGYVFVLGDNREDSLDSRAKQVGFVYTKDIAGKAVWCVSPMDSFGDIYQNMEYSMGD